MHSLCSRTQLGLKTLIKTTLSYPIDRCRNCGFHKTHVRLASLNGRKYELELCKQRYKCKSCHTTFDAVTNLTKENQTLSSDLKNQIMLLMSFICCDAETHQIVTKLQDRLSPTIVDYFENRYTKAKCECVQSVVIDLNTQYQSFIYRLFPNANIIIDRFHLVQLAGRALDNYRVSLLKKLDKHSQEYKIMKSHWKLFHKKAEDLHPEKVIFLRSVNQYMTRQNAVDLITNKFAKFAEVYQTYQDITKTLAK